MGSLQILGLWKKSWKHHNQILRRSKNKNWKSRIFPIKLSFKLPQNNQIPAQNFQFGLKTQNITLKNRQAPYEISSQSLLLSPKHLSDEMVYFQMNFTTHLSDRNTQIKGFLVIQTFWANFDKIPTWSAILAVMFGLWLLPASFTQWDLKTMFIIKSMKVTCPCFKSIEKTKIFMLMKLQTELLIRKILVLKTDLRKAIILCKGSNKASCRKGPCNIKWSNNLCLMKNMSSMKFLTLFSCLISGINLLSSMSKSL